MRKLLSKWNLMHDGAKASIVFAMSSFIIKGISFVTTPIFTRILETSEYGIVTTYSSWKSIIEVFALLGLTSAGVFNVGLKDNKKDDERNRYISSILILCNIVTLLVFFIIIIIKRSFYHDFILPETLIIAMFVYLFFSPAQIFWITRQRYEYKYKAALIVTIISAILTQIIAILAILNYSSLRTTLTPGGVRIWANTFAALITQIPIYIILLRRGKRLINVPLWKDTLRFSLPLLPHYLAQHVMNSSDKIMISSMYSSSGAAIYGVVSNITMITTIVWSAINASIIPYTFEALDNKTEKRTNNVIVPVLLFYAIMCVGVTIIAPEIIRILGPEEYYGGVYAVPPIAATAFTAALYNIYANVEFYHKKSWWIAFSTIVSALTNVILNYLLIPQMGYVAAAYTTLFSHLVLIIMHYIGYRRCSDTRFYNDRIIFIITMCVLLACLSCYFLYLNNIIRYLVLVIIVMICFAKRKYIVGKLAEIKNK